MSVTDWLYWLCGMAALVESLRYSQAAWVAAQRSRPLWIVVLVCTSVIGAVLYLVFVRPRLTSGHIDPAFAEVPSSPWLSRTPTSKATSERWK